MEIDNRKRIGIFLLIIGIIVFISSYFVDIETNIPVQNILTLVFGILGISLMLIAIFLLIIKKNPQEKSKIIQEKEVQKTKTTEEPLKREKR